MSANRKKNLRKPTWADGKVDPTDVGEALRDLYTVIASFPTIEVVELPEFIYSPPFFITHDSIPKAIILGRASPAKSPGSVTTATVAWHWTTQGASIDGIGGLVIGTRYDLIFLVFG